MIKHDRRGETMRIRQHVGEGDYEGTPFVLAFSLSTGMPVVSFGDDAGTTVTFEVGDILHLAARFAGVARPRPYEDLLRDPVYCKDCRHSRPETHRGERDLVCWLRPGLGGVKVPDYGFCNYAQKRDRG